MTTAIHPVALKNYRDQKRWTQEQLAEATKGKNRVSLPTIKRIESTKGSAYPANDRVAEGLAKALGVSVDKLAKPLTDEAEREASLRQFGYRPLRTMLDAETALAFNMVQHIYGIPFRFEKRNKGAGHMEVDRELVLPTIRKLATFDHGVLQLFRPQPDAEGYGTEYDIQRDLLINWAETVFAQEGYGVVQDEFPVDGGLTSRRIDILSQHPSTQDWLIIELKRAEAAPAAVAQVADYLLALGRKDEFNGGRLEGCLIAERISDPVASACRAEGIRAYEISWPLKLLRKA